jgi:hypothetical protein
MQADDALAKTPSLYSQLTLNDYLAYGIGAFRRLMAQHNNMLALAYTHSTRHIHPHN